MTEEKDKMKFGFDFQVKILSVCIADKDMFDFCIGFIKPEYYSESLQPIVKLMYMMKYKYKAYPTIVSLHEELRNRYQQEEKVQVIDKLLKKVEYHTKDLSDIDYISQRVRDFAKRQAVRSSILSSVELLADEKYDDIYESIKSAISVGDSMTIGMDYYAEIEERIDIRKNYKKLKIPTMIPTLDKVTNGGLGVGELGVFLAPSGRGKSQILAYISKSASFLGYNVIHYTMEISQEKTGNRIDATYADIKLRDMITQEEEVRNILTDKFKEVKGKLLIKFFPTKSITVGGLKSHIKLCKQNGIIPDMVVVDYGDILKPNTRYRDKRDDVAGIYEELRGMAGELKIPVWTATQTNRGGLNKEIVTKEDVSESFEKIMISDLVVAMCQTPKEKTENMMRLYVDKNRDDADGMQFDTFVDFYRGCKFTWDEE